MLNRVRPRDPGGALAPTVALLGVTAVWGSTFVVVKAAIAQMPVLGFLAWRFALATVAMVALRPRVLGRLGPATVRRGAVLGVALGLGYVTQTFGLLSTPASVSGFITGMFVVFTPLLSALLLGRPVAGSAWLGVGMATAGLALIALRGTVGADLGVALTLACAVFFALHIVGLGAWSAQESAYPLAVVQLAVVAILCTGAAPLHGGLGVPRGASVWFALALTALAATALAFVVQTWAQSVLSPTRAAVVMTMEPVFAGGFGVLVGGDTLDGRTLAGAALVVAAMFLVELGPRRAADAEVARLEA